MTGARDIADAAAQADDESAAARAAASPPETAADVVAPLPEPGAAAAGGEPVAGTRDAAAADAAPAPSPGTRLRERREARGLGVQQITDSLHIEPRLVAALEADDYAAFDAPVFAKGFLRKYAAFLELPQDEIVAGYEALHRGPSSPSLIPPTTAAETPRDWSAFRVPAIATLVVALVAGSYWWWLTRAPEPAPAPASQAPAVESASANVPASAPEPVAGATTEDASAASPADAGGTRVPASAPAASAADAGARAAPPAPVLGQAAVPSVATATPVRPASRDALEFRFTADCWIEVYGPAGERLLFDLARAGESRAVSGPGPWRVFAGYADGVRVSVGGRAVAIPAARRRGATARFAIAADGSAQ